MSQIYMEDYFIFILIGGFGIILLLTGIKIVTTAKNNNSSCTKKTEGCVVKYANFLDSGVTRAYAMYCPVIEYYVDGVSYRVKKKFSGISMTIVKNPVPHFKSQASEGCSGLLEVSLGPDSNKLKLAEELWPINSKVTVYYNPDNPKISYVDRPISSSNVSNVLISFSIVTILLTIISFFIAYTGSKF